MKYTVLIERPVMKAMSTIPIRERERIVAAIRELGENPRPVGSKKLSGKEAWRIRIGQYRAIYEIHDEKILVLVVHVGHRKNIYTRCSSFLFLTILTY